jgi:hypothetical protein
MLPSLPKLVLAKLNWSAAFQISEPPPVTVQLPFVAEAEPASAGAPMSASLQPGGRPAQAGQFPTKRSETKMVNLNDGRESFNKRGGGKLINRFDFSDHGSTHDLFAGTLEVIQSFVLCRAAFGEQQSKLAATRIVEIHFHLPCRKPSRRDASPSGRTRNELTGWSIYSPQIWNGTVQPGSQNVSANSFDPLPPIN